LYEYLSSSSPSQLGVAGECAQSCLIHAFTFSIIFITITKSCLQNVVL
jgi:hypothetical protein